MLKRNPAPELCLPGMQPDDPNEASELTGVASGTPPEAHAPLVTVGVRFHDITRLGYLERCMHGIGAQDGVRVHVRLALQGFDPDAWRLTHEAALRALEGSAFRLTTANVPNPFGTDLRARLLNQIVTSHRAAGESDYLCFIDFDDLWFKHALQTLIGPLRDAPFAMSFADVHCADVYADGGQFYLRDIKDIYNISSKTKRDLMKDNFLPLHSYMFHTGRVEPALLTYDERLDRLEDYDVLLSIARQHAVSGLYRRKLIGLYNFYTTSADSTNTTPNIFGSTSQRGQDDRWKAAARAVITRHAGKPWGEFWGEEWVY